MKDLFEVRSIENVITLKGNYATPKKLSEGDYFAKIEGESKVFRIHALEVIVNSQKPIRKLQITADSENSILLENMLKKDKNGEKTIELFIEEESVFSFKYGTITSIVVLHGDRKDEISENSYEASLLIDNNERYRGRFYQVRNRNEVDLKVELDIFSELNDAINCGKPCKIVV